MSFSLKTLKPNSLIYIDYIWIVNFLLSSNHNPVVFSWTIFQIFDIWPLQILRLYR